MIDYSGVTDAEFFKQYGTLTPARIERLLDRVEELEEELDAAFEADQEEED